MGVAENRVSGSDVLESLFTTFVYLLSRYFQVWK